MTFDVVPLRIRAAVQSELRLDTNYLRGHLGKALRQADRKMYDRFFAPKQIDGPSGLKNAPRPFVMRVEPQVLSHGDPFEFRLHLFDPGEDIVKMQAALRTFLRIDRIESRLLHLPIESTRSASCIRIEFRTPTELKWGADLRVRGRSPDRPLLAGEQRDPGIARGAGGAAPIFDILFARIRDRISTLRALYQGGPLEIDFKAIAARAAQIKMTRCEIQHVEVERTSRATGQTHSLGGFTGFAEYEGDLGEFLPYLEIAHWTGVGRQTVWGKGEIVTETL